MVCRVCGCAQNIEQRSFSQSICGIGLVQVDTAGSSAPYCLAIEARSVIAFTPAGLLTVHLPAASNQAPPHWIRIGLNWIMVHCAVCIANLKPCRTNVLPSLMVRRFATSPNCSKDCGQSFSGSRPASLKCLVLR